MGDGRIRIRKIDLPSRKDHLESHQSILFYVPISHFRPVRFILYFLLLKFEFFAQLQTFSTANIQLTSIFFTLLLSTAVVAKGNKTTKAVTDKSLCKEMASLEKTVAPAANTTKLEAKTKNNATKIADFQAKGSEAAKPLLLVRIKHNHHRISSTNFRSCYHAIQHYPDLNLRRDLCR
jgi:hypothetical protein